MNDWKTKRTMAIVESDDFQDRWDRNGLNFLFYWKAQCPKFKITLFTIPDRTSQVFLDLIAKHGDWIELAMHGWNHESNFECYGWSEEKTKIYADRLNKSYYKTIFKAPGWSITPGFNGYPASERDPLFENPQAVYRALNDRKFLIVDRHYNKLARPDNSNILCIDCNDDIVHFHTWNVPSGDINQRNGFQDIEENFGVPWDNSTEFFFISEALERNLIKPCQK